MHNKDEMRDWADMRVFLAIVDHGSLVAAAEHLDVTQPTLGRRLTALQKRLGVKLFMRDGRRMALTDSGHAILDSARRMQTEMMAIQRAVDASATGLAGSVTISATEGTGTEWLPMAMRNFHHDYPDIHLKFLIESRAVDIAQREADIALRLNDPSHPDLIAKRLTQMAFGLFASRRYLERHGPIEHEADLAGHAAVALSTELHDSKLVPFRSHPLDATLRFVITTNSPSAQVAAVRAGYGIGVLSYRWARMYDDLVPVIPNEVIGSTDLWIVTHEELRHSARIRTVWDYLSERVISSASEMEPPATT
ncbi:MAG: LysR family transcriptional regulator [Pseudomonadota bacterium]